MGGMHMVGNTKWWSVFAQQSLPVLTSCFGIISATSLAIYQVSSVLQDALWLELMQMLEVTSKQVHTHDT
jgi:hypothetical protein